jgi:radical SAM protein with 4Fe4S-binding SPASM domain
MYFSTLKKIAAEIDIFQKKTENKIAIEKKIITNASLLTDDIAIFLKQNKINTNISLDGIGRYNDLTRKFIYGRKPTYPLIKRGIEIARKHNILSHITATITAKNIEHLPDFASYLLKQKIKFQFQFYKEVNQHCHEKPVKIDEKTSASYLRAIKTVYRMYGEMDQKNETANPLNDKYQPMFISEQGCAAGNMEFTITPDCQIKVCPASEVKIPYDKTEDFIRDIKKINAPFTDYSVDTHPICKKCLWRYLCKGGCRLEMLKYDKLRSIPPRCYIFKKMLPLAIKLEAKRIINTNIISLAKT